MHFLHFCFFSFLKIFLHLSISTCLHFDIFAFLPLYIFCTFTFLHFSDWPCQPNLRVQQLAECLIRSLVDWGRPTRPVFFEAKVLCVHSFQKKTSKCCNTTIQPKRAWSQTKHGKSTPTRSGSENPFPCQKRSAIGQFLPNILTANNSSDRRGKQSCQHVVLKF